MTTASIEATTPAATIISFVSPVNGAGRTSALANVAWVLASGGRRVLTIDWCTKTPRLHDYLRPFLLETVPAGQLLGEQLAELATPANGGRAEQRGPALTAPPSGIESGRLHTYVVPASTNRLAMVGLDAAAPPHPMHDQEHAIELRRLLQRSQFDYVLIDSPMDSSVSAVRYLATLCDAAVVCSAPRWASLRDAVSIAEGLCAHATAGIRVLALPQIDNVEPRRGRFRDAVRAAYAPLLDERSAEVDWRSEIGIVEVPYEPYDTFDDVLAAIADPPGATGTLADAFAQATAWLTGGEVTSVAPVPAGVRRRYLRGVRLAPDDSVEHIVVSYAPPDRPWADWVREQLQHSGAQVRLRGSAEEAAGDGTAGDGAATDATLLAVISPHYRQLPGHESALAGLDGQGTEVLGVLVGGEPDDGYAPAQLIDLRGTNAVRARSLLLSHFGLIAPRKVETEAAGAVGYPGEDSDRPTIFQVPPRNPNFVGRSDYLERLRDHLLAEPTPVTLAGGAGVGKSEIVRELAYRFAYDYDLVWWVSAQDAESVRAGLGALGKRLGVAETAGVAEATLKELSEPRDKRLRWLLIYDNADQIDTLELLLPRGGAGHVVITSRDDGSNDLPAPLEVGAFHGEESVALLLDRVPGIAVEQARAIARSVGHLPLALRLIAAWIQRNMETLVRLGNSTMVALERCVVELRARLEQSAVAAAEEPIPGSHTSSVARALAITIDSMGHDEHGRLAVRLAEMASFLSPEGVSLRLLRSSAMLTQLAVAAGIDPDELLLDAVDVDQVLLYGGRYALFDVTWGRGAALQIHRAVQLLLRERMDEGQRRARQTQLLRGLAAYAPTDPSIDDEELRYLFDELQPHLVPSQALASDDPAVRHWIVKQVRYLYRLGDGATWRSALRVAEQVRQRWTASGDHDELSLRLCTEIANLHRGLGNYREALELDERILDLQRAALGLRHHATLVTGRGRGGDLRGLGRFADAVVEDEVTYAGFRAILGEEHPNTRMAVHNLAVSFFLTGDAREALRLESQEKERRLRMFGPQDPRTWRAACTVGSFQREVGQYHLSASTLREALNHIHALRPPGHQDELQVVQSLAATERRLGNKATAKKRSTDAFNGYRELFGPDHPFTRGAQLGLAADYFWAGEARYAINLAMPCLRGYEKRLGARHPFTGVAAVNLGVFCRAAGDLDQAVADGERGLGVLQEVLGEAHPWTLAAGIDLAGHLAAGNDLARAAKLQDQVTQRCVRLLGWDHPYTKAAQANLAAIRALDGHHEGDDAPVPVSVDIDIPQT
jgi:Mrp family chromosome partitioning ATPase/tetratricopeptide (TPR) repeat protein